METLGVTSENAEGTKEGPWWGEMVMGLYGSTGDPQVRGLRHRDTHIVTLWELAEHLEMGNSNLSALTARYWDH